MHNPFQKRGLQRQFRRHGQTYSGGFNVSPYSVPLLSNLSVLVGLDFLGQLVCHHFEIVGHQLLGPTGISPQPFIGGAKFSFRPTDNLDEAF